MTPPLKFAVVREDPSLERVLTVRTLAREVLTVASGGCTALTLLAHDPSLRVTAFDFNPTQLAHVEAKATAAACGDLAALNVGTDARAGLNQCGEFEGLFRTLRALIEEFVCPRETLEAFFAGEGSGDALVATMRASRYWDAAFALPFSDALLHTMFGPAATQHAAPGSYPGYFRDVFERGLRRDDARENPFLQHVLLGRYRAAPAYVHHDPGDRLALVEGSLDAVRDLDRFDVYSLSNVFDWGDDMLVADWSSRLLRAMRPGSCVLIRQLNNTRDVRRFFGDAVRFDDALGRDLAARDRSLFYNRIEVGFRV